MNDRLFVIAIGGTGMRCLEAFVHLCAIGMFDNEEINILTLDTDQSNGNKGRVERLIELYNKVKTDNPATPGGSPNANTYFSAKLNLYRFYTDYSKASRSSYAKISATQGLQREVEMMTATWPTSFLTTTPCRALTSTTATARKRTLARC